MRMAGVPPEHPLTSRPSYRAGATEMSPDWTLEVWNSPAAEAVAWPRITSLNIAVLLVPSWIVTIGIPVGVSPATVVENAWNTPARESLLSRQSDTAPMLPKQLIRPTGSPPSVKNAVELSDGQRKIGTSCRRAGAF